MGITGRKESLSYSFSYTDYIVSVDASRTNGGLDGLKLLNAKFRLANLENTYTYLEGVAKRALLKKSSVVLKDFSGKACNKTAFMEAKKLSLSAKLKEVEAVGLKVKKGGKLILGGSKKIWIDPEKLCAYVEGRRKTPF